MEKLNAIWRLIATALSFSIFAVGGLFLSFIILPLVIVFVRPEKRRHLLARRIICLAFRMFLNIMRLLGVLTFQVEGIERLNRPGQLVLANHPTLIDVVFLIAFIQKANCMVKADLKKSPITYGPVTATGYIHNDTSTEAIASALHSLASGDSLVLFPEGTRTAPGLTFNAIKRGAANVAVRSNCIVTPVLITCTPLTLSKEHKWYHIPSKRFHMQMRVLEDLSMTSFRSGAVESIQARRFSVYLTRFFTQHLQETQTYARP